MEVRKGYKMTEVGVVPEDWEVRDISSLTSKIGSGKTPTGGSNVYENHGLPFVRSQNIGWGDLRLSDLAFISPAVHHTFLGSEIQESDILLNITGASIGRAAIATHEIAGGNVNQHVCILRSDRDELDPRFLQEIIISRICQNQIDDFQAGGNRQGLNFQQAGSIKIPLPPTLHEQHLIATALGDADAWIRSLEALLAKKRLVKEGVMGELLTPGAGWRIVKLSDVAQVTRGASPRPN